MKRRGLDACLPIAILDAVAADEWEVYVVDTIVGSSIANLKELRPGTV